MPTPGHGTRISTGPAFRGGKDWTHGGRATEGVAAVARATGARLDARWARGTHLFVAVDEVPRALLPQALESSPLLAEEPFAGFAAGPTADTVPDMERYGVELAARDNGIAGEALYTLALAVLDGCGPPEARAQLRAELATRAAAHPPGHGPEARQAAVWQALGDMLAREEGAGFDGPTVMCHLTRAMTGGNGQPRAAPLPAAQCPPRHGPRRWTDRSTSLTHLTDPTDGLTG